MMSAGRRSEAHRKASGNPNRSCSPHVVVPESDRLCPIDSDGALAAGDKPEGVSPLAKKRDETCE